MTDSSAPNDGYRIGAVAAVTGLTVRSLHYYEEIGLLVATGRTSSGHRWYTDNDLQCLYRIRLLRQIGLPLSDIGRALNDPQWSLREAMARQLAQLRSQMDIEERLSQRLARLVQSTGPTSSPQTEELLKLMEEMNMLDHSVQRRISVLVYDDLQAMYDYLIRVFGLEPGQLTRNDQEGFIHGELIAGDGVIWLHPERAQSKLASPLRSASSTSMTVLMVDDVDAHYRRAVAEGGDIQYEPIDQPYGYREYSARDPEGGLWSFMKPLD